MQEEVNHNFFIAIYIETLYRHDKVHNRYLYSYRLFKYTLKPIENIYKVLIYLYKAIYNYYPLALLLSLPFT